MCEKCHLWRFRFSVILVTFVTPVTLVRNLCYIELRGQLWSVYLGEFALRILIFACC